MHSKIKVFIAENTYFNCNEILLCCICKRGNTITYVGANYQYFQAYVFVYVHITQVEFNADGLFKTDKLKSNSDL